MLNQTNLKLRISGGEKKRSLIYVPENVRPTKNIVKQALFSIVESKIKGAVCADIFCGSGSLGLEALSRGAKFCVFIDSQNKSVEATIKNIKKLNYQNKSKVYLKSAENFLKGNTQKFDIIFLDPPYKKRIDNILPNLLKSIKLNGIVVYLHGANTKLPENVNILTQRKFGKTVITIFGKNGSTKKKNK